MQASILSVSAEVPSLTLEGICDAQAKDENIQAVLNTLSDGAKPPHDSLLDYPEEARILLAQWDSLVLENDVLYRRCLLYTSPSPRDRTRSRMPSSA